jgi:23S rRNA (guanine2535-N1)-methyltransferase
MPRLENAGPYNVYDPCCGSAYLLATLAYLHWPAIRRLVGSDVDPAVIPLAERNLSLTTLAGVEARIAQLAQWHDQFGKDSHAQALASAQRLRVQLLSHHARHPIPSQVFVADALHPADLREQLARGTVDIVITDLPYGQRTSWHATTSPTSFDPGSQLLEALREVVTPASIIAITTTKQQKIAHNAYQRVEHFQLGKRHTRFFTLK